MNSQYYQINPKEEIIKRYIKSFSINVQNFIFNQSITLLVSFYDENGVHIKNEFLMLEGQDYNNWSNDDSYIVNYVCKKYNLVLQK